MTMSHALELESVLDSHAPPESERMGARACACQASFERLVIAEYGYVSGLVSRILGWQSEVDDVVQDVFVSALGSWPKFRGECAARTWLTRIALNKCRSLQRRAWLRSRLSARWRAERQALAGEKTQAGGSEELHDHLRAALLRLRQRDRELIVLYYLEHTPVGDIAAMLNVSQNAVEVRLTRARRRLKQILQQEIR